MAWGKLIPAMVASAILALAAAACAEEETPPAEPTPSPAATASPSPAAVETPAPSPGPTEEATPGRPTVLDLAVTTPKLTIFAANAGDLRNDVPALAVGDFNGDGIQDLLIGARFGDGPDNTREEAGEAYVVFGSHSLPDSLDIALGQQHVTIFGAKPGHNLGMAVASGDINGDGIDDLIVSSPISWGPREERTNVGETYVIFGSPDLKGTIDIAQGQQDVTIFGAEGIGLLGDSLAAADVNGDGVDDLIVGAPFAGREPGSPPGGPRTELGEVYVVFGSASLRGEISIGADHQDFTIGGTERFGELGDAVTAGDVNGDGIADIIAAAEAADGPEGERSNAGEVYVVFGAPDLKGRVSMAEGEYDLRILGIDPQDALGFSVASGDVNGDGVDDIIMVAQRAGGPGNTRDTAGEAYIIFGAADLGGSVDLAAGEQDVIIFGSDAHDLLSFCAAHDINGDGIDDIILGTGFGRGPGNARDRAGEAYIIFGSADLGGIIDLSGGSQDVVLFGAEAEDRLGSSLASGDLDGDGREELVVVAAHGDGPENGRPDAGEIYVIGPIQVEQSSR